MSCWDNTAPIVRLDASVVTSKTFSKLQRVTMVMSHIDALRLVNDFALVGDQPNSFYLKMLVRGETIWA